eukprot:FR736059.1.p1 GENE.FR736059.1~~FR736059.1.p1  ORF type:complete len:149 (+),score=19.42 FR736059.1:373-819(+)
MLINESKGNLISVQNSGATSKTNIELEAEGESKAILMNAKEQADAIRIVAEALDSGSTDNENTAMAAKLALAHIYVQMYGQMGSTSNTMLFQERPADLNALVAYASVVLSNPGSKKLHRPAHRTQKATDVRVQTPALLVCSAVESVSK